MKFVKGISLFFIFPVVMFAIGFFAGVKCMHFFYPGEQTQRVVQEESHSAFDGEHESNISSSDINDEPDSLADNENAENLNSNMVSEFADTEPVTFEAASEVSSSMETLSVDTEYIVEETDLINGTVVETTGKVPDKYIGLNREQFLEAIDTFELFPPLSEIERGFVNAEVLSFSGERVVVQMNYQYVQPSPSFYLAVRDNEVVVYLEDMETIYINTGIELTSLPEDMQQEIMQMLWIEDEEKLYNFLESYSS